MIGKSQLKIYFTFSKFTFLSKTGVEFILETFIILPFYGYSVQCFSGYISDLISEKVYIALPIVKI